MPQALYTTPPDDTQEFYDRALKSMRDRHYERSTRKVSGLDTCAYRGDRCNCLVGEQIPDTLYSPDMEGKTIDSLFDEFAVIRMHFTNVAGEVCWDVQRAHDTYTSKEPLRFEFEMREIARIRNLRYTPPGETIHV